MSRMGTLSTPRRSLVQVASSRLARSTVETWVIKAEKGEQARFDTISPFRLISHASNLFGISE